MFHFFVVLSIIISIASISNYLTIESTADDTLEVLAKNDGQFPSNFRHDKHFSPELPFESRYFSVSMTTDGEVTSTNTEKIRAIDSSTAITYAQEIFANKKTRGFISDYRYQTITSEDANSIQMIFLDCGRDLRSFRSFVFTSIGVAMIGLLLVLLLLIFVSAKIVKPFSENYEKQKRFITDAGHELKTPLAIIQADTEILEMDFGENEWILDIKEQTKRLTDLTNNLVFLARMEEEHPQIEMMDFPLSDIVEEMLTPFQSLAKTQNKTLTSTIQPLINMKGNEKTIRQLISIFMDNAIKYCPEGGKISLSLEKQKNHIKLCVYNTTSSISKDSLPHLFDRFYRTDTSRNSKTGGYGLGLSIALAIINTHKGKVVATTDDEKSLLITVTFPI
ncbi:Two component system histidine kinase [Lachnospiraceae bacterium TWA4]|nr:Two component system histidine kinase [Lachnospiraceae bacterium TWA4]